MSRKICRVEYIFSSRAVAELLLLICNFSHDWITIHIIQKLFLLLNQFQTETILFNILHKKTCTKKSHWSLTISDDWNIILMFCFCFSLNIKISHPFWYNNIECMHVFIAYWLMWPWNFFLATTFQKFIRLVHRDYFHSFIYL